MKPVIELNLIQRNVQGKPHLVLTESELRKADPWNRSLNLIGNIVDIHSIHRVELESDWNVGIFVEDLSKGDIVEARSTWSPGHRRQRKGNFFEVESIDPDQLLLILQPITYNRAKAFFHRKTVASMKNAEPSTHLDPVDLEYAYKDFCEASDVTGSVVALAKAIAWFDLAIRVTAGKLGGQLPEDFQKSLNKLKKLRMRAGHPATPMQEKETSLFVSLRMMEKMVKSTVAPPVLLENAIQLKAAGNVVQISGTRKPKTKPASRAPRAPRGTGTGGPQSSEVEPIAVAIMAILGSRATIHRSKSRISIKWRGRSGTLFAMFAKRTKVQIMCPVLDQLGVQETDRTGTPILLLNKPVDIAVVEDWARKVKGVL